VEDRGWPAYAAEFIGTFLLVLFIALIITVNSKAGLGYTDFAVIGLLHAFVLMMLIQTLGGTSGGHFNPAITATLTVLRKIAPIDAAVYILLQLAGGVAGALIAKAIVVDEGRTVNYGAPAVSSLLSGRTFGGMAVELIGTFVLMWAVMGVAVNPRGSKDWTGFVIGATLGFAVMTFGPLTGASLNPARAFGPAVVSGEFGGAGKWIVVYVIGPLLGAIIAGVGYTALVLRDQERLFGGRLVDADVPPGRVPGQVEAAEAGPGERPIDKLS